jgi:spore maturation protein CgeB
MKILFVGYLAWGTTSDYRIRALRRNYQTLHSIDLCDYVGEYTARSVLERVWLRAGWSPAKKRLRLRLVREVDRFKPDLVWIENCALVDGDIVRAIHETHRCTVLHYTPDSLRAPGVKTRGLVEATPEYEVLVTTKHNEVAEYKMMGAHQVLFTEQGFDPFIHRPWKLSPDEDLQYRCDVMFAGQCMDLRRQALETLALRTRPRLFVYGRQWKPSDSAVGGLIHYRPWVFAEQYAKAICGAKIALAFLNREVGDTHTTRTFEIPACGALMIAERTAHQMELFEEDKEAVFFETAEELVDKVEFYLDNEEARSRVALAGRARCVQSDYTWQRRVSALLQTLGFNDAVVRTEDILACG